MKIYEERKMNAMYLLHNMQRVGDLKPGMEIMVSTIDKVYFTDEPNINSLSSDYDINKPAMVIDEDLLRDESDGFKLIKPFTEALENIKTLKENKVIETLLTFKNINDVQCIILTLREDIINNIKSKYKDEDYIVFDNLTITKQDYGKNKYITRELKETLAILIQPVKMHTEEEITEFYISIIDKMLAKEDTVSRLLNGEEVTDEHGTIFIKNNIENELKDLSQWIIQIKNYEDKLLALKIIFSSYDKTPLQILKLIGVANLNNLDNALITRTFS